MEAFGTITLTATTSTGNLQQIYPSWVTAGDSIPFSASGGTLLRPEGGRLGQVSVETDSTDGGIIELYDLSGLDIAADVSSLTAVTNAQLTTLTNNGQAKKIWAQNFAASPGAPVVWTWSQNFMRGLAARFVGSAGTCNLNIIGEGLYSKRFIAGPYRGG